MENMKNGIFVLFFLFGGLPTFAQFEGGDGDGHDIGKATQIDLQGQPYGVTSLYEGGMGDGHDHQLESSWMNGGNTDQVYSGGIGDGYDRQTVSTVMNGQSLTALFSGGNGDGYDFLGIQSFLNNQSSSVLYTGGFGDGYDFDAVQSLLSGQLLDMLYGGGAGDGHDHALIQTSITGIDFAALYKGGDGDGVDKAESIGSAIPFPVVLLSFNAFPENDYVIVQWVTESELNNDFFTIERSTDASIFRKLEEIAGAGTTDELQEYQTYDLRPIIGQSFYRLKSTDFDGAFTYSQIVEVNFEAPSNWNFLVFPNPNSGEHINLKLSGIESGKEVHAEIIDMQGRKVWESDFISNASVLDEVIDLERRLPEGSYQIRMLIEDEQISKMVIIR